MLSYASIGVVVSACLSILVAKCIARLVTHKSVGIAAAGGMRRYRREHPLKARWLIDIPMLCAVAPAVEEPLFRAPLIVGWSGLTASAWVAVVVSSVVFSVTHARNLRVIDPRLQASGLSKRSFVFMRIMHFGLVTAAGIALSLLAISSQSLWPSMVAHALWNLIGPYVFLAITLCVAAIVVPVVHGAKCVRNLTSTGVASVQEWAGRTVLRPSMEEETQ